MPVAASPLTLIRADIWFASLGWTPLRGALPVDNGPVEFRVVAPWCPDCEEWGPTLAKGMDRAAHPIYLVGEFASAADIMAYANRFWPDSAPVLAGASEKSEISRVESRLLQVRTSFGDARKWGVPSVIQGRLFNGRLLVEKLFDPSA